MHILNSGVRIARGTNTHCGFVMIGTLQPRVMRLIVLLSLGLMPLLGYSQEPLDIRFTDYYALTGEPIPDELYRFNPGPFADRLAAIFASEDQPADIKFVACNVASVTVARSDKDNYVLYNRFFLMGLADPVVADLVLAVAAGYYAASWTGYPVNSSDDSTLPLPQAQARFAAETKRAVHFAGYTLYRLHNLDKASLPLLINAWNILANQSKEELLQSLQNGFDKAAAILLLGPSAAYHDTGDGQSLAGIPEFPFPPPRASTQRDLTSFFAQTQALGKIADRLQACLLDNGYYEYQYYYVNGGFALVSRIEQYESNGTSLPEPDRWSATPYQGDDSWLGYLRNLFTSNPGHFRVFVFVVSNTPLVTDNSRAVSRETALAWLQEGAGSLPLQIRQQMTQATTTVSALIYDFETSDTSGATVFKQPSDLTSIVHLQKARLLPLIRP